MLQCLESQKEKYFQISYYRIKCLKDMINKENKILFYETEKKACFDQVPNYKIFFDTEQE